MFWKAYVNRRESLERVVSLPNRGVWKRTVDMQKCTQIGGTLSLGAGALSQRLEVAAQSALEQRLKAKTFSSGTERASFFWASFVDVCVRSDDDAAKDLSSLSFDTFDVLSTTPCLSLSLSSIFDLFHKKPKARVRTTRYSFLFEAPSLGAARLEATLARERVEKAQPSPAPGQQQQRRRQQPHPSAQLRCSDAVPELRALEHSPLGSRQR